MSPGARVPLLLSSVCLRAMSMRQRTTVTLSAAFCHPERSEGSRYPIAHRIRASPRPSCLLLHSHLFYSLAARRVTLSAAKGLLAPTVVLLHLF